MLPPSTRSRSSAASGREIHPYTAESLTIRCARRSVPYMAEKLFPSPRATPDDVGELAATVAAWRNGAPLTDPPWVFAWKAGRGWPVGTVGVLAGWIVPTTRGAEPQPWRVLAVLRFVAGAPLLERVMVEHWDDQTMEVTGHVLRGVPLAELRNRAVAHLRVQEIAAGIVKSAEWNEGLPLRRGPKGYPSSHYRRLVIRYLELVGAGHRDVLRRLENESPTLFGNEVKYQTIRSQLRRATVLGFLAPATKQGRAADRPGPNLYRKENDDG